MTYQSSFIIPNLAHPEVKATVEVMGQGPVTVTMVARAVWANNIRPVLITQDREVHELMDVLHDAGLEDA